MAAVVLGWQSSWAVDENETVGFQTNHVFAPGAFGEDIDILNGGLNLSIPIGQKYQVSQYLSYQLILSYSSKIWDHSDNADHTDKLMGRSNVGLGFRLHMGRIYKDIEYSGPATYQCNWVFVTPDGNQHIIKASECDQADQNHDLPIDGTLTTDTKYFAVSGFGSVAAWNGTTQPPPTLHVTTADGNLSYEFGHLVQVAGMNQAHFSEPADLYVTNHNRDFGGWYVTRIVDLRSPGQGSWVSVNYDTDPGYEHAISSIQDSLHRQIIFTNECEIASGTTCRQSEVGPQDGRVSVRTASIAVPAFKPTSDVELPNTHTFATYTFHYAWKPVNHNDADTVCSGADPTNCTQSSTNVLTSIEFPQYTNHAGVPQPRYQMRFAYGLIACDFALNPTCDPLGNAQPKPFANGELIARMLPTGDIDVYTWAPYYYQTGDTRQMVRKTRYARMHDLGASSLQVEAQWQYIRQGVETGSNMTNPLYVTVIDGLGNETDYFYNASEPKPPDPVPPPPETPPPPVSYVDGYTPEWNDGANVRTEYYEGYGSDRRLVRAETTGYDVDLDQNNSKTANNLRPSRKVTIYQDDGGKQSTVEYRDWNGKGLWRETVESGQDVDGVRVTHTDYGSTGDPNYYLYKEVSDGNQVVTRSDYAYDSLNRRTLSIDRLTLPLAPQTAGSMSAANGDVVTVFTYNDDSTLAKKELCQTSGCFTLMTNGSASANSRTFGILYSWLSGGYLLTKQFMSDLSSGAAYGWKAIDRDRDPNTGLIFSSKDTAQVQTRYLYDAIGRVTDIIPPGTEHHTTIEYISDANGLPLKTAVLKGVTGNYDCDNSATGDFTLACYSYDTHGRLVKTQNRLPDITSGSAYQTAEYAVDDRITFKSEWLLQGQPPVGTLYDYGDPSTFGVGGISRTWDPFRRVRTVETADGKMTQTTYFGNSSATTVRGIARENETAFDSTVTYIRDVWNRLREVLGPGSVAANANYDYDLRDNLILAELSNAAPSLIQERHFEYDGLGRMHAVSLPESGTEVYTDYDALGKALRKVDGSGNITTSTYDPAGRLVTVASQLYQAPGAPVPPSIILERNTYDESGRGIYSAGKLTTTDSYDASGIWVHTRNSYFDEPNIVGRLSKEENLFAGWPTGVVAPFLYGYNQFGLMSRIDYPEGPSGAKGAFAVQYTYQNGVPVTVQKICKAPETCSPTDIVSLKYNPAGGVSMVTTMPGISAPAVTQITPDMRNRPAEIQIGQWNGSAVQTSGFYDSGLYVYDGAGNIAQIGPNRYGYDALSRLVSATDISNDNDYRRQVYAYDGFGNMVSKSEYNVSGAQDSSDTFVVADLVQHTNVNQVLSHTSGSYYYPFAYDARGNVIKGDGRAYELDPLNHLTSIRPIATSGTATELSRYAYEANGNRVRTESLSRQLISYYVRDGSGRLLSEFRKTNEATYTPEWVNHQIYVGDRLVALRENQLPPPPSGLHGDTDWIGTPSHVTISWQANPPDIGAKAVKYRLYRSPNSTPSSWSLVGETTSLSQDDDVTTNTWYKYLVTGLDAQNHESYGSDAFVYRASTQTPPSVIPSGLQAVASSNRVTLSWNVIPSSQKVSGYHVYRGPGGSAVRLTTTPLLHPSFVDLTVTNGTLYTYSVTAVRTTGQESPHSTEVQAMPSDSAPPGMPLSVTAGAACDGSKDVSISWLVDGSSSADIQTYRLFRVPAFSVGGALDVGTVNNYLDADVNDDTSYTYWLKAVDLSGNLSIESLHKTVQTRATDGTVPQPGRPGVVAGDGLVRVILPATPAGIQNVRVYRKRNVDVDCEAYELVGIASPTTAEVPDSAVVNAVAYDYALTYVDGLSRESKLSQATVGVPLGAPWGFRQCVELLGAPDATWSNWKPGANSCPIGDLRRNVLRWQTPGAPVYQPLLASAGIGTLGYLTGYHLYKSLYPGTASTTYDSTGLVAQSLNLDDGHCILHPDVPCKQSSHCPAGDGCSGTFYVCTKNPSRMCTQSPDDCGTDGPCAPSAYYCELNPSHRCIHCDLNPDSTCSPSSVCQLTGQAPNQTCVSTLCQTTWGNCTNEQFAIGGVCEGRVPNSCSVSSGDCGFPDADFTTVGTDNVTGRCEIHSGLCAKQPHPGCSMDTDCGGHMRCVSGTCACSIDTDCPILSSYSCVDHQCVRDVNGIAGVCATDDDCHVDERCVDSLEDSYIVKRQDSGANVFLNYPGLGDVGSAGNCPVVKAAYQVYYDGKWHPMESGPSDNYDAENQDWVNRCVETYPRICEASAANVRCEQPLPEPPRVKSASATVNGGTITVAWNPPGTCEQTILATCASSGDCPSGEYCHLELSDSGYCLRNSPVACSSVSDCAAGNQCLVRDDDIDGYLIYAVEGAGDAISHSGVSRLMHGYHYRSQFPIARVDKTVRSYTFTALSPLLSRVDIPVPTQYGFSIASYDRGGQVSARSDATPSVSPAVTGALAAPASVKVTPWRTYDPLYATDAVKVSWLPGASYVGLLGYRLWRSTSQHGPFCALIPGTDPTTGAPFLQCVNQGSLNPTDISTVGVSYLDATAQQGQVTYYYVTAVTDSESSPSQLVTGMVLPHQANTISAPDHFKAEAPHGMVKYNGSTEMAHIYLSWCPNSAEEGVTSYHVYRATSAGGPYTRIASNVPATCMDGYHRCEILAGGTTNIYGICASNADGPNCCQNASISVENGNCKVVDTTVSPSTPANQAVYYYVVTAVRGNGLNDPESSFSIENQGRPNYSPSASGGLWILRFDPDEAPDTPCGPDSSELLPSELPGADDSDANDSDVAEDLYSSPYRSIGEMVGATPMAVPRIIFYHLDHLGSPRIITDETGAILLNDAGNQTGKHRYLPFGDEKPVLAQGSSNTLQFTGHERDAESGLDYMMARYYSSSLGRFMAVDPGRDTKLEDPQSWNKYTYVRNNPLKFTDPDGKALDAQGQSIADHAKKDPEISDKQKDDYKTAESDSVDRQTVVSPKAAFAHEDKNGNVTDKQEFDVTTPKGKAEADKVNQDIKSGKSDLTPLGGNTVKNKDGSFTSTVYGGSQQYADKATKALSPETFVARVEGHEIGHTLKYSEQECQDREK
jgi:RHS repeat-associated protein